MILTLGSDDVTAFRAAIGHLEGLSALQRFAYVYANVGPNGGLLTERSSILEGLLFVVWLEACAELGVLPSDPTIAARKTRPTP